MPTKREILIKPNMNKNGANAIISLSARGQLFGIKLWK